MTRLNGRTGPLRHPAEDEIDEVCGEFFYIIAPNVLPGCPPPGACPSILKGIDHTPPATGSGEEIGRYPVGMRGGVR